MERVTATALAAISLGVLSLVLAGCGGSTGLSQAQIDAKANAICQEGTRQVAAVGPLPADFTTNPTAAATYLDRVAPISDKASSELATLVPAGSVKAAWNDFVVKNRAAASALDAARTKAHGSDPSGIVDFQQATGPLTQVLDASARAVGATACAN